MECERALEAISAALDGELTRSERAELEAHLSACPSCRALAKDLRAVAVALEQTAPPPPELSVRVAERIAAEGKVVPISSGRRRWQRWAGLAAMAALVVCVGGLGLWLSGGESGTVSLMNAAGYASQSEDGPPADPDSGTDAPEDQALQPEENGVGYSLPPRSGEKADNDSKDILTSAAVPAPDSLDAAGERANGQQSNFQPIHCFFQNEQAVRVTWGATPAAPAARILGSVQSLEEFAAEFPADDLSQVLEPYDEDYFRCQRLLAVVLEEQSGSVLHRIAPQGLCSDEVRIMRAVSEVGTDDMAAWIILAEVDPIFEDGEVLHVVMED